MDKSAIEIVHIDYGTKGNAGQYLMQVLKSYTGPLPMTAFVHSDFPLGCTNTHIHRIFDHLSNFIPGRMLRQAYKWIDLSICFALLLIFLRLKARKRRIIVFVQFFQSFRAYGWFFRSVKTFSTLVVTVHDAIELSHNYPKFVMGNRDEIIQNAQFLLVHGDESVEKLSYLKKNILQIPFPLMEPAPPTLDSEIPCDLENVVRFLFIGHIRIEKGVDVLIDAWRNLPDEIVNNASLTIAGTYNGELDVDFNCLKNCNLHFGFLDDSHFSELIHDCHYVVLPYKGGTNSGVYSIACGLNRPCVTSNIPLFTSSKFYQGELSYCNCSELRDLLCNIVLTHSEKYEEYRESILRAKRSYMEDFSRQLCGAINEIVKKHG